MKITKVFRNDRLMDPNEPDHLEIHLFETNNDADVEAFVYWPYLSSKFETLRRIAKKNGGVWDEDIKAWKFLFPEGKKAVESLKKAVPDWPIIGNDIKKHGWKGTLSGVEYSYFEMNREIAACLLPYPLPYFLQLEYPKDFVFQILGSSKKDQELRLVIGKKEEINRMSASLNDQGAKKNGKLFKKVCFSLDSKVRIVVSGWKVQIKCDLSNPLHYLIFPEQKYEWIDFYPHGERVPVHFLGQIDTTRKLWRKWKAKLTDAGVNWEGDDPEGEISVPVIFDKTKVPGWSSPATNGWSLHMYQKKGALFCARRGMRALVGDEMGVGKTAEAIAAAEGTSAGRVLVICPANARYVWDREIKGWGSGGKIQHVANQLDSLAPEARWHIVTYDQIVSKTATWTIKDLEEEKAFLTTFPDRKSKFLGKKFPKKISIDTYSDLVPALDRKRADSWEKMMKRLSGSMLRQILTSGPILVIVDEAHRVKNRDAKRTKAIRQIAADEENGVLLLTGTPLRNHEHEAITLLSFLDPEVDDYLDKKKGYTIQDVKDYLDHFMIRRTKAEVLPELPEKTRQRIDIDPLDSEMMENYRNALLFAQECYYSAIKKGMSQGEARNAMRGGIEMARKFLGIAKVEGGEIADLVANVVEDKGCCVVFCAHQQVSDLLSHQLGQRKIKSKVVDGRMTRQGERAKIVDEFQNDHLDVFIGGIHAAGEAITLTRSDTVIFVELDWVPAALMQAEDRIHRVGQKRNCQIIQVIARVSGENLDEDMILALGSKMKRIGEVLGENGENIAMEVSGSIQNDVFSKILNSQERLKIKKSIAEYNEMLEKWESEIFIDGSNETLMDDGSVPADRSNETLMDDGSVTADGSNETLMDDGSNQEKIKKRRLQGAERSRRWRERSKSDEKAEKIRIQTKERVRRFREKHKEDYKSKHREYLKKWRKLKKEEQHISIPFNK